MARVKIAGREDVPAEMRDWFDGLLAYGPFGNQIGALANRPTILKHVYGLLTELREEGVLPRRYLELALVVVSELNACDYCVTHHAPMLSVEGVSPEGVKTLLDYENHPELDDTDKLVIEYAKQVTTDHNRVRDQIFERLKAVFTDAQIVELTWRIALCGAFNRFNDVLQLEIEDEATAKAEAALVA